MVTIYFFAGLKRYFSAPIKLEIEQGTNAKSVIDSLKKQTAEAGDLLDNCRVAINEDFVDKNTIVESDSELFLIPPSSGG